MPQTPRVLVILGSTRQRRFGEVVARWIMRVGSAREDMQLELVDLRDWKLSYYDRPNVAAVSEYDEEAARWADVVGAADGFVIVSPEYNHGYPAVLKSALDAVYKEWNRKPVAFVTYGGWSGGVRAMEQLRQVVIELQMTPVRGNVVLQFAPRTFDDTGNPVQAELYQRAATGMLDDLAWWAKALRDARASTA